VAASTVRQILVASVLGLAACTHITHPARVLPGNSVDILVGRVHDDYAADNTLVRVPEPAQDFTVGQLHLRHGWLFPDGRGVQAEVVLQKRWRENESANRSVTASGWAWLDLYGQLLAGPVDAGVGALVGVDPQIYAMIGKRFGLTADWAVDGAFGSRVGYFDSLSREASEQDGLRLEPFANLAFTTGRLRLGAFADTMITTGPPVKLCEDSCYHDSFVDGQLTLGLFAGAGW
jgi:hypothetical protein